MHADDMQTALTLDAVFAATRLLSESVASLPLQTFRRSGGGKSRIDDPSLLREPSHHGTAYEWLQRAMVSLLLRGNAYGYITEFTSDGEHPRRIEWLHPDDVSTDDDTLLRTMRSTGEPVWRYRGAPIPNDRMVHIPGYTLPGQRLGLSPIAAYAMTTETGLSAKRFGRDWFRNGSIPSAVLETAEPVTQDQARTIKERFRAAVSGREPVVLGAGTSYKPITVPPNESQFLATIKATANTIAAIYGVPPERIGGEAASSRTYANREQESQDFVTFSLRPHLVKLEAHLSALLPRPQYVKFNVDALIRADLLTRYQAHSLALHDGWKSKDEVRELEDEPPLPDGQGAGFATTTGEGSAGMDRLQDAGRTNQ
ncbi:phage portal protein [Saccharopolyspora shandongensis]|uniref:phage portal protein n=1 Tax=Saccharopolyspora shandongensis TaxID=418495 RepID=UPI0034419868